MADPMHVILRQVGPVAFEAEGASGGRVLVDGPAKLGGENRGMRPMEMLLTALASCSAMDVVMILRQQRQNLEDLQIRVDGVRSDAVPAVFTEVHLHFEATGKIEPQKLERAARLSVEKYCSVASMLRDEVRVTYATSLRAPAPVESEA